MAISRYLSCPRCTSNNVIRQRRVLCSLFFNGERSLELSQRMEYDRSDLKCLPRLGSKKDKVSAWLPICLCLYLCRPPSLSPSLFFSMDDHHWNPAARLWGSSALGDADIQRNWGFLQTPPICQLFERGSLEMDPTIQPSSPRLQMPLAAANIWLQPHEPPSHGVPDS